MRDAIGFFIAINVLAGLVAGASIALSRGSIGAWIAAGVYLALCLALAARGRTFFELLLLGSFAIIVQVALNAVIAHLGDALVVFIHAKWVTTVVRESREGLPLAYVRAVHPKTKTGR